MTATATIANTGTAASNQANITAGQQNLSTSYSDFLTLLTTQLKNQDPSTPMDTNTFTQQLVSMTGVQQQLLTNQLLQQMVTSQSGSVAGDVSLIGKTITATSATSTLSNGAASWSYNLPSAAASATATVSNAAGSVVWSGPLTGLSQGSNAFTWNGSTLSGSQLPDGGTYTLGITAKDASGSPITPTLSVSGQATAVQMVNGVAQVTVNGAVIPVSDVTKVSAQ